MLAWAIVHRVNVVINQTVWFCPWEALPCLVLPAGCLSVNNSCGSLFGAQLDVLGGDTSSARKCCTNWHKVVGRITIAELELSMEHFKVQYLQERKEWTHSFGLKLITQFLFRHDPKGKYLQIWPLRTKLILTAVELSNSELGRKSSFGTVPFRISFKPEESLSGEKNGEVWIAPKPRRFLSPLVSMHQRILL